MSKKRVPNKGKRTSTGLPALDHVLGGGLVGGSVVLLASRPGMGKSTLTLQMLDGLCCRCLYVTGDEEPVQVAARGRRIEAMSDRICVYAAQNTSQIFEHAVRSQVLVIDPLLRMRCADVKGHPGSRAQIKACLSG